MTVDPKARTGELGGLDQTIRFVVWGPPSHGPRSKVFARKLGIEVDFVHSSKRRGALSAPFRYIAQALGTLRLLIRERPEVVFVQSPPSLAPLAAYLYAVATRNRFVIDAHSTAMQKWYWTRPVWLHTVIARRAVTTIVTNQAFADGLIARGARALIVPDIPTEFPGSGETGHPSVSTVTVVNTFAADEPLTEVLEAAAALPRVTFNVTGSTSRADSGVLTTAPPNVIFTGYLDDPDYYDLLRASAVVVCLTTRDNTMQRGACEALSLSRPIVTSDWPLLRSYFRKGALHVDNTAAGIRSAIAEVLTDEARFEAEIEGLRSEQHRIWDEAATTLAALLDEGYPPPTTVNDRTER